MQFVGLDDPIVFVESTKVAFIKPFWNSTCENDTGVSPECEVIFDNGMSIFLKHKITDVAECVKENRPIYYFEKKPLNVRPENLLQHLKTD
jgi:hypothetical protein